MSIHYVYIECGNSFVWHITQKVFILIRHFTVSHKLVTFSSYLVSTNQSILLIPFSQHQNWLFLNRFRKMSSTIGPLKRNIEIKARISNDAGFQKRIEIAKKLASTQGEILKQRDVFYKVNSGRLKLRMEVRKFLIEYYY